MARPEVVALAVRARPVGGAAMMARPVVEEAYFLPCTSYLLLPISYFLIDSYLLHLTFYFLLPTFYFLKFYLLLPAAPSRGAFVKAFF